MHGASIEDSSFDPIFNADSQNLSITLPGWTLVTDMAQGVLHRRGLVDGRSFGPAGRCETRGAGKPLAGALHHSYETPDRGGRRSHCERLRLAMAGSARHGNTSAPGTSPICCWGW